MTKLVRPDPKFWPGDDYGYWCPGCNEMHTIAVTKRNASGASWSFKGDALRGQTVDLPDFPENKHFSCERL